jgi:hypothetical protein
MSEEAVLPTNRYNVKVIVEFNYEVETTSEAEAEEEGWKWEDYTMFSEVYSIDVDLEEEDIYGELEEDEEEEG